VTVEVAGREQFKAGDTDADGDDPPIAPIASAGHELAPL